MGRRGPLAIDIGSALVGIRSGNKASAAPHYKRGHGFRPMICSAADGEPLRPGNAAANGTADRLEAPDAAAQMPPPADAAGHRDGDGPAERPLVVRIDAAGCSPEPAKSPRNRNIGCAASARNTPGAEAAIRSVLCGPSRQHDALTHPKQHRGRAQAADLAGLAERPKRTRPAVRREPRRPGAQRSLSPSDSFRCWRFLTDQPRRPTRPDELMRSHADVEDAAARLKDNGLARTPLTEPDPSDRQNRHPPHRKNDLHNSHKQSGLVAGAGFEPATFGL